MKKLLLILSMILIFTVLLSGCKKQETSQTKVVSTTESGTEEITEQSKKLIDYLPTGLDAKDILINYCEEHGYSFDDWNIVANTQTDYQATKPGGGEGGIIAQQNKLIFNLGKTNGNNWVMMSLDSDSVLSIQISDDSSLNAYEVMELLFDSCPEQLMPPVEELKEKTSQAPNKFIDIEKGGLYFRACHYDLNSVLDHIGVYSEKPGGWKG